MYQYIWIIVPFVLLTAYIAVTVDLPPMSILSSGMDKPASLPLENPSAVKAKQTDSGLNTSGIGNNVAMSSSTSLPVSSSDFTLPEIFNMTENSVVQITSTRPTTNEVVIINGKQIPQNDVALGSGFVYDQEGHIITNYHVVADTKEVDVTFVDGDTYNAKVIGKDPYSDIGVIQITDNEFLQKGLAPLKIANSSELQVGEQIIAIGNPFGLSGTLTTGVISQKGRLLPNEVTGYSIANTLQTDAAINPGNSGGPLLNMKGEVVGMNTAIFSSTGVYSGVGFAVPSNMLSKEIPVLIEKGSYVHPWLGFTARDLSPEIAESLGLERNYKGAAVVSVVANSPADKAGVRGEILKEDIGGAQVVRSGDIVTKVDGQPVKTMDDVISYLDENKEVGDNIILTLNREGKTSDVTITLEERPSGSPQLISASQKQEDGSTPNPPLFQFPKIPGFPELPKLFP